MTSVAVAPWFSAARYKTGAYSAVNKAVGDLIDWYNIQFYNRTSYIVPPLPVSHSMYAEGSSEYTTCDNLLLFSSNQWPNTAVFQLAENGVELHKIVIGKPATGADAVNGFMDTTTLATCLVQAKERGWFGVRLPLPY